MTHTVPPLALPPLAIPLPEGVSGGSKRPRTVSEEEPLAFTKRARLSPALQQRVSVLERQVTELKAVNYMLSLNYIASQAIAKEYSYSHQVSANYCANMKMAQCMFDPAQRLAFYDRLSQELISQHESWLTFMRALVQPAASQIPPAPPADAEPAAAPETLAADLTLTMPTEGGGDASALPLPESPRTDTD